MRRLRQKKIPRGLKKFFYKEDGIMKKKETWIEKDVKDILIKERINYSQEHKVTYKNYTKVYDFFCHYEDEKQSYQFLIEVNGDHWHGAEFVIESMKNAKKKPNKIQTKNMRNDRIKKKIAKELGIPLLEIWEHELKNYRESIIQEIVNFKNKCTTKYN